MSRPETATIADLDRNAIKQLGHAQRDERLLIAMVVRFTEVPYRRFAFYGMFLIPLLAFGLYGCTERDWLALAIALFGLLLFQFWRISLELRHMKLFLSIFKKVLAFEEQDDQRPPSV